MPPYWRRPSGISNDPRDDMQVKLTNDVAKRANIDLVGLRLTEGTVAVPDPNLELREQRSFAVAAHGDLSSLMRSNGLRKVSFVAVQSGPRYLELPCR